MNNNEEENPHDGAIPASEPSPDEEMIEEATEILDGLADDTLEDTERDFDDDLGELAGGDTADVAEPGKDWLVDTGLAAAINPQTDIPEESSDDYYEDNAGYESAESVYEKDEDEIGGNSY